MKLFFLGPRILGVRTGLIATPQELFGRSYRPVTGSFLYVIEGTHGMVKIGVTKNPVQRLATLQTGSPFPLVMPAVWATPGEGYDIEAGAHAYLAQHRVQGEWFSCRPGKAIEAVEDTARILGLPILRTPPDAVGHILATVGSVDAPAPKPLPAGVRWTLGAILGALFGLLLAFIGRIIS